MIDYNALPLWIALPAAFFLVLGSTLALIGALGLVQLKTFYDRLHAPTLATSWGTAGILIASMLIFSWATDRIVVHELVIGIFIMVTTPMTLMFLGRAALQRDRAEGAEGIPGATTPDSAAPQVADEGAEEAL